MSELVVIIDYESGNLHSARKAFERVARERGNARVEVSKDPEHVRRADRIVLPGVGAFADCRAGLDRVPGMVDILTEMVRQRAVPFLGICVGAQLLGTRGLEKQQTQGFGWIDGDVVPIKPNDPSLPVPHMGWNTLDLAGSETSHPLLDGIPLGPNGWHAYFVHSYHLEATNGEDMIATSPYGTPVTAVVGRENVVGTQFHPEKSQRLGLALIDNFLDWTP